MMANTDFPVTIGPEALLHVRRLLARKGEPGDAIRVGVKGGGCSGYEYVLRIEPAPRETDFVTEIDGVTVVCDPKSAVFLKGAELKWTGNLVGHGFAFENPNAARSCGCGTSFTIKE